jgi:hypothetical protein
VRQALARVALEVVPLDREILSTQHARSDLFPIGAIDRP